MPDIPVFSTNCPTCGEPERWVLDERCDECHERAFGIDSFDYDPIGAVKDSAEWAQKRDLEMVNADTGRTTRGQAAQVLALIECVRALEDAIRFRDRVNGAPPAWLLAESAAPRGTEE